MLRRDFLKRMAFAAIASGVLGRLPLLRVDPPVVTIEEVHPVDLLRTHYHMTQYEATRMLTQALARS